MASWWLLHWQDGDEFLGVNIVQADDPAAAQIRAQELNIAPGSDDWAPIYPDGFDHDCPPNGRVPGNYQHRFVRNDQVELLVCASCGVETQGARQIRGLATIAQLPPERPMPDLATEIGWETVADRLLSQQQLIQFGLATTGSPV